MAALRRQQEMLAPIRGISKTYARVQATAAGLVNATDTHNEAQIGKALIKLNKEVDPRFQGGLYSTAGYRIGKEKLIARKYSVR